MSYFPTNHLKWVEMGGRATAMVLMQRWEADRVGEFDEWREVPVETLEKAVQVTEEPNPPAYQEKLDSAYWKRRFEEVSENYRLIGAHNTLLASQNEAMDTVLRDLLGTFENLAWLSNEPNPQVKAVGAVAKKAIENLHKALGEQK